MSQALYTSMSGIKAGTTEIEVVSNNVANINTTAFKASSINFADVYSTTLSYGSVAIGNSGGTNPIQIGVGVKTSAISKDFSSGSVISTGKSTDLMIQGSGFFTVLSPDNQVYYTRAGDFSWDNRGNLVTPTGYKVYGTDNIYSSTTTKSTVYVPTSIIPIVKGNPDIGSTKVTELNGLSSHITQGKFYMAITDDASPATTLEREIILDQNSLSGDVDLLVNQINYYLTHKDDGTGTMVADASGVTASAVDGKIVFTVGGATAAGTNAASISWGPINPTHSNTSNFLTATGVSNSVIDGSSYSSPILDSSCDISDVTSVAEATGISSISIGEDGSVQATYQNGDSLSVQLMADGINYQFVYTTQEGIAIKGDALNVNTNVAVPANFVIQMATITNQDGLLSVGSNLFKAGPNVGTITYTVGNQMGSGLLASGSLEASNVDLSEELSSMILAQRAVQANSRVFTTTSNVMETITNMAR